MPAVSLDQLLQQWSERKTQLGKKDGEADRKTIKRIFDRMVS